MGTFVEISIEHQTQNDAQVSFWFQVAFARLTQLQQRLSIHERNSELSAVNLNPYQWLSVSRDTRRLLQLAMILMAKSDGLFNPTLGAALLPDALIPDFGYGQRALVGSEQALSFRHNQVRLNEPVIVCLDGVAKGFAVDMALATLKRLGCEHAAINAGGDIRAMGKRCVPIQTRLQPSHSGLLHNAALATSGCYHEAAFRSRLMDVKGQFLPTQRQEWSVLAHTAWRADALTKIAALSQGDEHRLAKLGGRLLSSPQLGAQLN
ncbi:FAD:protein FMN transferase [Pseudoalteromonas fenneropenaei]|uniref:FAD:protein FMN transferase n=1 Tax=Pseudoalteromonas fenneropenaei TaxID=1737459 RepID=A0ABV7CGJ4_9GAMM